MNAQIVLVTACLWLTAFPFAIQEGSAPVTVLKMRWERERLTMPGSFATFASAEELTATARRERQLAAARNAGDRGATARLETESERHSAAVAKAQQVQPPRDGYRYRATLRNDSSKTIKTIDWDYLFIEPDTDHVVMRHQFASDEKIKPGKTKEVSVLYPNPPAKTISVRMLTGKDPLPFSEKVVIARVTYEDGTTWEHP